MLNDDSLQILQVNSDNDDDDDNYTTTTDDLELENDCKIFKYNNLVVPMAMRSNYWKYFGFPSNDGQKIITRSKVICALCRATLAYNKNTTNLKSHLMARHKSTLAKVLRQNELGKRGIPIPISSEFPEIHKLITSLAPSPRKRIKNCKIKLELFDDYEIEEYDFEPGEIDESKEEFVVIPKDEEEHIEMIDHEVSSDIEYNPQLNNQEQSNIHDDNIVEINDDIEEDDNHFEGDEHNRNNNNYNDDYVDEDENDDDVFLVQEIEDDHVPEATIVPTLTSTKHQESVDLNTEITNMIVTDLLSTEIVDGVGFNKLLKTLGAVNTPTKIEVIVFLLSILLLKVQSQTSDPKYQLSIC